MISKGDCAEGLLRHQTRRLRAGHLVPEPDINLAIPSRLVEDPFVPAADGRACAETVPDDAE